MFVAAALVNADRDERRRALEGLEKAIERGDTFEESEDSKMRRRDAETLANIAWLKAHMGGTRSG